MITHRFRDKANGSRPVQLALYYVVNCPSSITNLKCTSLNTSNSSWANDNLTTLMFAINTSFTPVMGKSRIDK